MRLDKLFRSRYKFVANFLERTRSFAKDDFVLAKQNSNDFVEHLLVAKVEYLLLLKEQQVLSRFEFLSARYVFANYFVSFAEHFVSLANRFVLLANYQFHAANLLEKFVSRRAKISHQSRKFVELFAVVVTLLLSVVISSVIFSTRFAIVMIVV